MRPRRTRPRGRPHARGPRRDPRRRGARPGGHRRRGAPVPGHPVRGGPRRREPVPRPARPARRRCRHPGDGPGCHHRGLAPRRPTGAPRRRGRDPAPRRRRPAPRPPRRVASQRARWTGRGGSDHGERARVRLRSSPPLVAEITLGSVDRLALEVGRDVFASFKAVEVRLLVPEGPVRLCGENSRTPPFRTRPAQTGSSPSRSCSSCASFPACSSWRSPWRC